MDNNSKIDYDVVVVGAGPIGSYTANALASSGYKVVVLERKAAAGEDICCTGIISAECFRLLDISTESIIRKAHSARFFLPSGRYIRLQSKYIETIVHQ
jgi:flavin-dependent dehydrogenase